MGRGRPRCGCSELYARKGHSPAKCSGEQSFSGRPGSVTIEARYIASSSWSDRLSIIVNFRYADERQIMNSIIYIVGLVVVVIAVLSFFGFR